MVGCRARTAVALVGVALLAGMAGCSSESDPPEHLVDGSRAEPPPLQLEAESPQILTRVALVDVSNVVASTAAGECLRSGDRAAAGPLVVTTGAAGLSVTFRTASGRALVACDAAARDRSWCGRAYGRLENGRLLDPRLDVACTTPGGDTIAFAWFTPGPDASYVAVRGKGYTEVYPVVGRLPVRITSDDIGGDRSSATFEISEHATGGALLRSSTLEARVAG